MKGPLRDGREGAKRARAAHGWKADFSRSEARAPAGVRAGLLLWSHGARHRGGPDRFLQGGIQTAKDSRSRATHDERLPGAVSVSQRRASDVRWQTALVPGD